MKVLLSAYACEPNRGSEEGNGWNWSSHLAQAGHEVWVLTRPDGREAIEQQFENTAVSNLRFVYVDVFFDVRPFLKGVIGIYVHYLMWQRAAYRVAQRLEQEHDFDVVHHVSYSTLAGGSWLWRLQKPFVFGPVGGGQVAPPAYKAYFFDQWWWEATRSFVIEKLLPLSLHTRNMLRQARLVLATNQETLNLAQRLNARKTQLFLDTGLPVHYYSAPSGARVADAKLKVLWVGRIFARKALPLSLEALSKTHIPFTLTILGDGPLGARLPEWIRACDLEGRVDWRGHVPWTEVQKAYQTHDVFLFTSLRDSCAAQLLEAMANGLPVVTLDHHGARDLVPDTAGIKVTVTTPEQTVSALAQALEELHSDPEKRAAMSQAGFAFAKTQEWSERVERMTKLYCSVVEQGKDSSK